MKARSIAWTVLALAFLPGVARGQRARSSARLARPLLSPAFRAAKARTLIRERLPCLGCHTLDGVGGRLAPPCERRRRAPRKLAREISLAPNATPQQYAAWRRSYRKAAEVDPANPAILVNMGLAEAERGNFAAATAAYESALALDRLQPLVWVNLGIARADRGDLAGAMQAYRSALALDPREPLAHFNLGGLWARLGRPDSALASFQRAAVLDPSLYMARFYSARFLLEQGRRSEALREIDAGLLFDPTNSEALPMRELLRQEGKR